MHLTTERTRAPTPSPLLVFGLPFPNSYLLVQAHTSSNSLRSSRRQEALTFLPPFLSPMRPFAANSFSDFRLNSYLLAIARIALGSAPFNGTSMLFHRRGGNSPNLMEILLGLFCLQLTPTRTRSHQLTSVPNCSNFRSQSPALRLLALDSLDSG
ncbi:MAG: hypothetical protein JWQ71_3382 [Pedosphaera sp.]|nr:hypothetical protein [Pedosphaera sp.]